jgi:DNA replication protein DnaD
MDKTFTVAGTSNLNGVIKFRFANDLKGRIKVLERNGHTDVQLFELPEAMTKEDAIVWLQARDGQEQVEPADEVAQEQAEIEQSMFEEQFGDAAPELIAEEFVEEADDTVDADSADEELVEEAEGAVDTDSIDEDEYEEVDHA